jgi:hypothetical protein
MLSKTKRQRMKNPNSPTIANRLLNAGLQCLLIATAIGVTSRSSPTAWGMENSTASIQQSMVHLRNGDPREWASFPQQPDAQQLAIQFEATANSTPFTLTLTQSDVKESWTVSLNSTRLGQLVRDENKLRTDFLIPAGLLKTGKNKIEISCRKNAAADDIRVGQMIIHSTSPEILRGSSTLQVAIINPNHNSIPGRITLTDKQGTLMPIGTKSGKGLAIREGVVYTTTGEARITIAPGEYRITAGRGFEYSAASTMIKIAAGETAKRTLVLEKQVETDQWIACDTHVHTVTHSGHGDCTIEERMATLAGEGIELPIATDHNKQIDYRPIAESEGATAHFTPVVGNEVTTKHGHFNVFPAIANGKTPDHQLLDWSKLFDNIYGTAQVRVAILNHARDLHSSFRPFSPRHHLSLTGDNLDAWQQRFNGMEVINSGAVQTDSMELFRDWCGLINHGLHVTPVGCSDSHDVSRYIVGQARTYIKANDRDPASINVDAALDSFLKGRVIVSYGIMVQLEVKSTDATAPHGPGDTISIRPKAASADATMLDVTATVMAPHWSHPSEVQLLINGVPKFTADLRSKSKTNQSFETTVKWQIPLEDLPHDAWLTAVAQGTGVQSPHWPTAKPYQPDSPIFEPHTFSCTGPIRLETDGSGKYESPRDYAKQLLDQTPIDAETGKPDLPVLAQSLTKYDEAVVNQALALLLDQDIEPSQLIAAGVGKRGRAFEMQWRQATQARIEQRE